MLTIPSRRLPALGATILCSAILSSCGNKSGDSSNTASGGATGGADTAAVQAPATAQPPAADVLAKFAKPRKAAGPLNIQIVTNAIDPFWDPMIAGMKDEGKALGVNANWTGPQKTDPALQRRLLEDAVSKGVDGIAVSAIEPKAAAPVINEIMAKGIPVITIDSDSPASNRLAYIGTNNFQAGVQAGNEAVKQMPKGGSLVAFVGTQSADNAAQRINGFKSVTEPKGIHILQVIDDQADKSKARKNVEDSISKYGDKVQGFLGIYSYNGPAIAAAVTAANKRSQYKVFCFDSDALTISGLKSKNIDYTVVQNPYKFGQYAVQILTEINRKGIAAAKSDTKLPDNYVMDTGVQIVRPDNVAAFEASLAKIGVKG